MHYLTAFVLMYCCDNVKLWKDDESIYLYKPAVYDLNNTDFRMFIVDKYVDNIINPAYHYFILRKEVEETCGGEEFAYGFILQLPSLLFVMNYIKRLLPEILINGMPKLISIIMILVISLIPCIIGCYIVWKIYNSKFSLPEFYYSNKMLKERFVYEGSDFDKEYGLEIDTAFNHYVILKHYEFILSLIDKVRFRKAVRRIISGLCVLIWLLFIKSAEP